MNARSLRGTVHAGKEVPCINRKKTKEKQIPIDER